MKPHLLVKTEREGYIEKLHYGFVWVIDEEFNIVFKQGEDYNTPFPFRSGAKPLQASVLTDCGCFGHFGLTHRELAVICASHTGEEEHVQAVRSVLEKIGLNEKHLQCTPKTPKNNCSGKHAGMLAVCVKNNWDINTYTEKNHPLQLRIMRKIRELCMLNESPGVVKDGCGAPVPVLPHYNMGIGYLNLFLDGKYRDIKKAMAEYPYIVGGKNKIDTELMRAEPGKLIAKVSAEGVCIVVNTERKQVLMVRITDANHNARSIAVWENLKKTGWLSLC